ncbi:hypothetical protein DSO57_1015123 [Entomophthora muscae]|uniref:Uncharacterized protein n=1 Tax=Entomophthora muscae TaxID=34485 RepID=A0ACC2SU01_9FUNG|nr:hypothetical protein DSO57_1015123 [Entomophthora muscae]
MKFIFLVWTFCVLISYGQANEKFETPKPTPTNKSEDSIWYCFGPCHCHAPYTETAQFPPIIHSNAPWLVLGYTSIYYLINHFTPFLGRFCLFDHLLHMLMIGVPVGSTLVKLNLGALLHSIGERLPNEWIPDTHQSDPQVLCANNIQADKEDKTTRHVCFPQREAQMQGLGKRKQGKVLHHNRLCTCKAQHKQQEAVLTATKQQLIQYGACAPKNLPEDLIEEEADPQPGGVKTAGSIPVRFCPNSSMICNPIFL